MGDTARHIMGQLKVIEQLRTHKISVVDVPKEYENDARIIKFERKKGLRVTERRGYDIISNSFFVEEILIYENEFEEECQKSIKVTFHDFNSYFTYLDGHIYENACYTFYEPSKEIVDTFKINAKKFRSRSAFVENSIDDFTLLSNEDLEGYKDAETIHKGCQRWISKFNSCNSYDEFLRVISQYRKSKLYTTVDITFFLFNFIFADVADSKRFSIIMEYMSSGADRIINALCSVYNPDAVLQAYKYSVGSQSTISRHKRNLKEYIQGLKAGNIGFSTSSYFDPETHYYVVKIQSFYKNNEQLYIPPMCRYFETFEEFITYRNGDLSDCNLSSALKLNVDFSKYITNSGTVLPPSNAQNLTYSIKKEYRGDKFYVQQQWSNACGKVTKEYKHTFEYFFDFVRFLNGDLSNANLILCEGLIHLSNIASINFKNAKMQSTVCEKLGQPYHTYCVDASLINSFSPTEQNEVETGLALQNVEHSLEIEEVDNQGSSDDAEIFDIEHQKVGYISDIHLMHKIQAANCRSKEDVVSVIQKIVNNISQGYCNILLIGGDVASDFEIFSIFVKLLSTALPYCTIVFVLGNHELWSFPGMEISQIVTKYRNLLNEYGMYLLHNDLFYEEDDGVHIIQYSELCKSSVVLLTEQLRNARYVILGGLGFSGYNTDFNANNGIYRQTIDRDTEIHESQKFEMLYDYLRPILSKKNVIILTHTPQKDWCANAAEPQKGFVYVSGHTHRNFFYDDGDYRIYADNQIGYHNSTAHLKYFSIANDYDCFDDYSDGIHEVTREQYCNFYRGKNIDMTFHRKNKLYMLKKNGYYCFICESGGNQLSILNGGAMKKLDSNNIQYYYDNMGNMIDIVKRPLDKFTSIQERIAQKVKLIGGSGKIHGCIVDIDFLNHIYVNPIDGTITAYWASDIVNKLVYPSVPALLEQNCPQLYNRYLKSLPDIKDSLALRQQSNISLLPRKYLETDIYTVSRVIKKMQKLNSNILSSWHDDKLSMRLHD